MWDQDIVGLFLRGGVVMWPLLACSIVGIALMLERAAFLLWKTVSFQRLKNRLQRWLQRRQFDEAIDALSGSRSPVACVAAAYLQHRHDPQKLRDDIVGREASLQLVSLEKRMGMLSLIAQLSPMLGLLGTVTGLVDAFHQIEIKAGQVQPADLASGIWEALLTTVFGLVIAIPCIVVYGWLDRRISLFVLQMEWITTYLDEWLTRDVALSLAPSVGQRDSGVRYQPPEKTLTHG